MDSARWSRLQDVVSSALALDAAERRAHVARELDGDRELAAEAFALLAEDERAARLEPARRAGLDALLGAPPAAVREGDAIGPWTVVRRLGGGGMGEVFLAERAGSGFAQRAAVKLVHVGAASRDVLARFERERRTLAALEHPGIARMIDGGETRAGLPYLAMEYVDGAPIDRHCAERSLAVRERVALVRQVCDAVAYAHRHLIVHRDLKPSNVLVTAESRVKLVDFGIARLLDVDDDERTTAGRSWLTPRYASPEQARGEPVTTSSDVYSLGVLLYELLTGHAPYEFPSKAPHDVARVICEQEPQKPSTAVARAAGADRRSETTRRLARRLSGDLDTIVLQALAKEPHRRLASAAEMSDELGRWLEGRAIRARADSSGYRLYKLVRRNPWASGAVAALALSLLAGTAITTSLYLDARARERELARRLEHVRALAQLLLNDAHDAIRGLAGATQVRLDLVQKSLARLEEMEADAAGDVGLLRAIGDGYLKLGQVQGAWRVGSLGDLAGAEASLAKHLALRGKIARETGTLEDRRGLALAEHVLGDLLMVSSRFDAAEPHLLAAVASLEELCAQGGGFEHDLANSLHAMGQLHFAQRHSEECVAWWERARDLANATLARQPGDRGARILLHQVASRMGELQRATGRIDEARASFESAFEIARVLAAEWPDDVQLRGDLALVRDNLGVVALVQGRLDDALALFEENLGIQRALAEADPGNAVARERLLFAHMRVGDAYDKQADYEASLPHFVRGVELGRAGVAAMPDRPEAKYLLASMLYRWAWTEKELRTDVDWLPPMQEAAALCRKLLARDPNDARVREVLAACEVDLPRGD